MLPKSIKNSNEVFSHTVLNTFFYFQVSSITGKSSVMNRFFKPTASALQRALQTHPPQLPRSSILCFGRNALDFWIFRLSVGKSLPKKNSQIFNGWFWRVTKLKTHNYTAKKNNKKEIVAKKHPRFWYVVWPFAINKHHCCCRFSAI